MPVYNLGASQSGGFRVLLPPDPEPRSKAGKIFGYALAFAIGLVVGILNCALMEDRASGPGRDNTPSAHSSN